MVKGYGGSHRQNQNRMGYAWDDLLYTASPVSQQAQVVNLTVLDAQFANSLKTTSGIRAGRAAGSHGGSHTDESPCDALDPREQPEETNPRSRTDLNGSVCPRWNLRIRRCWQWLECAEGMAGPRSGDGPLSVRVRPSSLKHDCGRRTTSTAGRCPVNVHAKSRLTPEPLRTLRSETKGQAAACPDRTRAIPCTVQGMAR